MNIIKFAKTITVLIAAGLLASCKISILVPEGGFVTNFGSSSCTTVNQGQACVIDISDTNFGTQFIAQPFPFFVFDHWYDGPGFLCAGSTDQNCIVDNTALAGVPFVEAFIATKETVYLMPVFKRDIATLTVDGKEWLRPSLFTGLSYDDIVAACPGGVCGNGAVILGQTMNDFVLASVDDVNGLFNAIIGGTPLVGPSGYSEIDSIWGPILTTMFGVTEIGPAGSRVSGLTRTPSGGSVYTADCTDLNSGVDSARTASTQSNGLSSPSVGAWFYRTPTP